MMCFVLLFMASKCILFPLHRLNVFPVIKDVDVLYAEAKLTDPGNTTLTTPIDPNEPGPQPIRWTNNVAWLTAEIEFRSKFPDLGKPPDHDPNGTTHFVTDFKYGIISASMRLEHDRGMYVSFCIYFLSIDTW